MLTFFLPASHLVWLYDPVAEADFGFEALADTWRGDEAAGARRRERWLARQAAEDLSLVGVLVSHAEKGSIVAVSTCSGGRHVGRLLAAGSQLLTLEVTGAHAYLRVDAIETVRPLPGSGDNSLEPRGHRGGADPIGLGEVLELLVEDRPDLTLVTTSGETLAGELVSVGRDVALVRPAGQQVVAYAPLASLSEVLVPASTVSG